MLLTTPSAAADLLSTLGIPIQRRQRWGALASLVIFSLRPPLKKVMSPRVG
jgi:hypothetical protein